MQNLISLWSAMDLRRKLMVLAATVGVFLAVLGLTRLAAVPQYALLYAGLDAAAAGEVIAALDQQGVSYQVRGDSIHVEADRRDALRMALAGEGLPAHGAAGYELLDGLSGFGTTSQMFDAAYWRAKEGELARTILANPQIRSARVHIAHAPVQPFRQQNGASASVTVATAGGSLSAAQARALRHLVAAAVAGMRPEDVSVIDTVGGLVADGDPSAMPDAGAEDRAAELRRNVERLLEARVGPGRAVVEVHVDLVTEREQITERRFDPQGRVTISTETEEKTDSSTNPGGAVTVASNLPEGDAAPGGAGQSQSSQSRERVNFEVSETQRELLRVPGSIRRLSVAVLVDGQRLLAADGAESWQPRPDEELAVLRELVASAVGLDENRGDVLTLKSLAFEPAVAGGTLVEASLFPTFGPIDVMTVIQTAVLALVVLVLALFVIRPLLVGSGRLPLLLRQEDGRPALPAAGQAAPLMKRDEGGVRVVTGEIDDVVELRDMPLVGRDEEQATPDPMQRLRRLIEERQADSVEILRSWMEVGEEGA